MQFNNIQNKQLGENLFFGIHESGLPIYVMPKKSVRSYASFAARYGSVDSAFKGEGGEDIVVPDGIAHFLEHKLFEKKDGGNAFDDYAKTGAYANAYTSFNTTAYLFHSTDKFTENLEILLSCVREPYFTDENVEKEQGIIGQEIKMYEDSASWRVFFNMLETMYVNHPTRKDIAGTVETISHINKEILYQCYDTFYNPANMVLFVAGDVPKELVAELADKHLENGKARGEIGRTLFSEPQNVSKDFVRQNLSVSAPIFLIGLKDADIGQSGNELLRKEIETNLILEMVLGKSSPLYRSLYEKGLINDTFGVDFTAERDYAYTSFGGESPNPEAVRDIVFAAIDSTTLNLADFSRAKNVLLGRYLRRFNSVERIGHDFVENIFKGINILDYMNVCNDVTLPSLRERFKSHFVRRNYTLSVVYPLEG